MSKFMEKSKDKKQQKEKVEEKPLKSILRKDRRRNRDEDSGSKEGEETKSDEQELKGEDLEKLIKLMMEAATNQNTEAIKTFNDEVVKMNLSEKNLQMLSVKMKILKSHYSQTQPNPIAAPGAPPFQQTQGVTTSAGPQQYGMDVPDANVSNANQNSFNKPNTPIYHPASINPSPGGQHQPFFGAENNRDEPSTAYSSRSMDSNNISWFLVVLTQFV